MTSKIYWWRTILIFALGWSFAQSQRTRNDLYSQVPKYSFSYEVKDGENHVDYQASQSRDNGQTSGSYSVLLPDGRWQTVTYEDRGNGLLADVSYDKPLQSGLKSYPNQDSTRLADILHTGGSRIARKLQGLSKPPLRRKPSFGRTNFRQNHNKVSQIRGNEAKGRPLPDSSKTFFGQTKRERHEKKPENRFPEIFYPVTSPNQIVSLPPRFRESSKVVPGVLDIKKSLPTPLKSIPAPDSFRLNKPVVQTPIRQQKVPHALPVLTPESLVHKTGSVKNHSIKKSKRTSQQSHIGVKKSSSTDQHTTPRGEISGNRKRKPSFAQVQKVAVSLPTIPRHNESEEAVNLPLILSPNSYSDTESEEHLPFVLAPKYYKL